MLLGARLHQDRLARGREVGSCGLWHSRSLPRSAASSWAGVDDGGSAAAADGRCWREKQQAGSGCPWIRMRGKCRSRSQSIALVRSGGVVERLAGAGELELVVRLSQACEGWKE